MGVNLRAIQKITLDHDSRLKYKLSFLTFKIWSKTPEDEYWIIQNKMYVYGRYVTP